MLAMSRRTYNCLTTGLMGLSVILFMGSLVALKTEWLQHADFLLRLAVFPGGLIAGGIVFLINGCVEHYADFLPSKYRQRGSTRHEWEALYDTEQMYVVESVLKRFARSHGFRTTDAFQFGPQDRIEDLMQEFYPGRSNTDVLFRQADLTNSVANTPPQLCLRKYVDAKRGLDQGKAGGETNVEGARPEPGSSSIDRGARNRLSNTIRRYTEEKLAAFAFDEEINEIRSATADPTVQFVVDSLWYHYDDCKDHLAGLSKPEWDCFQRLILLLDSDAKIERDRQRHWSVRQVVAGMALIGFGQCVVCFGIGWHLFGFAVLFGPVSILLSYWRDRSEWRQAEKRLPFAPFSSISELRAVRKTAPGFSKRRYPAGAQVRRVHSRLMTMAVWLQAAVLWSFVSPLILLFQTLPEKETQIRIRQGAA